ncbi:phenylalanine--tRNA ligase subunit beta [Candidatus Saccharibacteria bacterium CG_4_10_14_0_2_um_filter_52_9]|nr:MAG: phenylalanine--tRNA ligase subunit beta [Candidatus Saccharibacteria bacterium CG_4_10_14_0_2_um_filter_52_9]
MPPGSTVPDTVGKDPFVLEARELRGVVINGMLASPKELALGDGHQGILEVDGDYQPGSDFSEAFGLKNDVVLDIENKMFTHRPDCFGFLGVARELAGIQQMAFKSPDWYVTEPEFPTPEAEELELTVKNELPELVPRFATIVLSNVQVGPSPVWLQVELAKIGQKSINNIVDYTNFFMQETGQPLHAYDYDKLKALSGGKATIVVRKPHKGEKIKLLNGKEIEPRSEAIMIATDKQAIGLGGVMGGSETEVDANTKNIILEAASFNMYSIRRTSMAHGLFTEAVTRFTKGQNPQQNLAVLARITDEIRQYVGGEVASPVIDLQHDVKPAVAVKTSTDFINQRLGEKLSAADMKKLLENVEFDVKTEGDNLTVTPPFWRTDIEIPEDVVEEVGRLYGYDHLPLKLPKRDLKPALPDPLFGTKSAIRQRLAKAGANEVLTYSFVHGDLLQKTGQDPKKAFQIANALSPDLQYYRMSLMPSLLDKVHPNSKAGYDEFALFEIGKTHSLDHGEDAGLPKEFEFTGLVVAATDKLKKAGAAYYQARQYLEALVDVDLEFKPAGKGMEKYAVVQPYDLKRSALVSVKGGAFLGIIGEFKPSVARALKLPRYSAGFEVDTTELQSVLSAGSGYSPLSRFPSVKQDITLKIAAAKSYQELYEFVDKQLGTNAPDDSLIRLDPGAIYQKADDTEHKQVTFRVTITGTNRTLTDKEVNNVLEAIAAAAKTELHAERI